MVTGKNTYFISDLHLGSKAFDNDKERELKVISFLNDIKSSCKTLYLLGDIFDYWFEYKYVVPKGYVRFLAKLCEFTDSGIEVHFYTGNHDIWVRDYLEKECGIIIHLCKTDIVTIDNLKLFLGHGDGLNPKDTGFLLLRALFHNKTVRWFYRWLIHPDINYSMGYSWSASNRKKKRGSQRSKKSVYVFDNEDVDFCREQLKKEHFDYFIFGHRHIILDISLADNCRYLNIGDWIYHFSYAVLEDGKIYLNKYSK